jgi:hypothetical protein
MFGVSGSRVRSTCLALVLSDDLAWRFKDQSILGPFLDDVIQVLGDEHIRTG